MKERSIKSNKVSNGNARNIEQNLPFLRQGYLTYSDNKCILIFHETDYSYLDTSLLEPPHYSALSLLITSLHGS